MKTNLEKVSNLERKLNVEVPAAVVGAAFEKVFKGIQKQAQIKGFRQGKAPIATIKSLYGDRVSQDVVQDLIEKHYFDALKEHSVDPINYPEFEFDAPTEGNNFSFTALFEIRPEITLKKYEGLDVEKEKFSFEESRVDQVLENIRAARAKLVKLEEDRACKKGDVAVIDFEGFIEGKPLENGVGKDHHLELGTNSFIEGFEEGVEGMKVGAEKTLNLKFPSPYHSAELAGKAVDFKVTLKEIKFKQLPELTDEFIKSIGGNETVEELKKTIREDLEASEKKQIEQDFKNNLLKALVKENPVEVPPSMLKEQKQILMEDTKKRMLEQGMSEQEFPEYVKKWDLEFEASAKEMIQAGFVIDAIAKKHDLKWTKADFDQKIEEYAKQTGLETAKIKEFYAKPEQTQRLTYMITEDKVVGFLTQSAKIKEITKKSDKKA